MRIALAILLFAVATAAQTARVKFISDGDSFVLESGERVRMIGINAPELADKFGPESKEHLARLIRGKTVLLESDPQNDDRDVHGRLLRFVSVDGTDINRQMIADGWAYAFLRYKFARSRRDAYRDAESSAKTSGAGIWNSGAIRPASSATQDVPAQSPGGEGATPDGSYSSNVLKLIIGGGVLLLLIWIASRLIRR